MVMPSTLARPRRASIRCTVFTALTTTQAGRRLSQVEQASSAPAELLWAAATIHLLVLSMFTAGSGPTGEHVYRLRMLFLAKCGISHFLAQDGSG